MSVEERTQTVQVDPGVLRAASTVLHDIGQQTATAAVSTLASTVTAARADSRWTTGLALEHVAKRWDDDLHRVTSDASRLSDAVAKAEAGYAAADTAALPANTDHGYFLAP